MSKEFNFEENPHRRFNPLTNSWVLCSPQRAKRPWLGQVESSTLEILPSYDPKCYLCPGNSRAQGDHNPNYSNTFLFDNDFSAVESISPDYETEVSDKFSWLLRTQSVKGQCKVMCFSPNHNVTLAEMSQEEISKVVETWIEIYQGLSSIPHINYIQIFENKGAIMGCSNPHPHCQIWSTDSIPCDHNPNYSNTFLFDNDFSAVESISPDYETEVSDKFSWLLRTQSVKGQCKVMCFSPNHNVTLAEMSQEEISKVVETWIEIYQGLSSIPHINYIQIFENKGAMMGCSNPHPHCQIWSTDSIPCEPTKELESMTNYFKKYQTCLLCDYILVEETKGKMRVVYENNSFICLTPYWSIWPFETMIISKFHLKNFNDFSKCDGNSLIKDFSNILHIITCKYDNLFQCSFPYSMGIHQSQTDNDGKNNICDSHFHVHFYPPLLRSATIKKFLVG
ncbi:15118_t:CDS:2, partial [Entrophospora sp. SA101]